MALAAVQSGVPGEDWDDLQHALQAHFLQSRAWGEFQAALGRNIASAASPGWSWLGVQQTAPGVHYLYVPYGPTILDSDADKGLPLTGVHQYAREQGFDFVRLEPCGLTAMQAAHLVNGLSIRTTRVRHVEDVQPSRTWVLDISQDLETLRHGLERGHRSRINAAPRKGVSYRRTAEPAEIQSFLDLLHVTAKHGTFRPHTDDYYRTMMQVLGPRECAALHFADHQGRPVAAAIGFDYGRTRYYAHAAADQELNRKTGAAVTLVWEMILGARDAGCTSFDFWGVAPTDDPNHPWAGLTSFKRSFGGRLVTRAGTWDLPINNLKYSLYRGARRLLRGR